MMGLGSDNSKGNWKENIMIKVKDTMSSTVSAFIDVFVKSPESNNIVKENVEMKNNLVTINGKELTFEQINNTDYFHYHYNLVNLSTIPQDFKDYFKNVAVVPGASSEDALSIKIVSTFDQNGDLDYHGGIQSKYETIGEDYKDSSAAINKHITDGWFTERRYA